MKKSRAERTGSCEGRRCGAFTLVEALITIAIIGVLASIVINAFSNAASDSRRVIARQQQAVVQSAINNWISAQLSGTKTVEQVRTDYNTTGGTARTVLERLQLVGAYLDDSTYQHLVESSTDSQLKSEALVKTNQYLDLPAWASGSYPKVDLKP